jgi:C-terminal processing protease CtpA/Prc
MREGEIQLRISGNLGSKVLLTVIREGVAAPIDIEVTRA